MFRIEKKRDLKNEIIFNFTRKVMGKLNVFESWKSSKKKWSIFLENAIKDNNGLLSDERNLKI